MRLAIAIALCGAALAACGDSGGGSADDVIAAWKAAGLEPGAFQKADALGGGKCRAGTVDGLPTTLCEFGSGEAAKKAQGAGYTTVGDTTGISLAEGKVLLVIADRKNADPNGKRMNQIAQVFRKRAR